jgi:hypothetical protein
MKDRIVNLADPGGRRYLRFSAAIEFAPLATDPAKKAEGAGYQLVAYEPELDEPGDLPVTGGASKDDEKLFQTAVKKFVPAIEDSVVTVLSSKTFEDIRVTEGKETAKREIRARVQASIGTALTVTNVYFTEFVVQ